MLRSTQTIYLPIEFHKYLKDLEEKEKIQDVSKTIRNEILAFIKEDDAFLERMRPFRSKERTKIVSISLGATLKSFLADYIRNSDFISFSEFVRYIVRRRIESDVNGHVKKEKVVKKSDFQKMTRRQRKEYFELQQREEQAKIARFVRESLKKAEELGIKNGSALRKPYYTRTPIFSE